MINQHGSYSNRQPPATAPAPVWKHPRVILLALTVLAGVLRLYRLSYHGYWDDEIITALASRPPVTEIFQSLPAISIHPPLFYILVHGWMQVAGDNLLALRLFSVLIGTMCVPAIYAVGRELISTPAALVAAFLMAVSPIQIFHSQQARMYPLLTLIVLVAVLLFVHAWRKGGWHRWLWFGGSVAVAFYTHVYAPFSILGLDVWALLHAYRHRRVDKERWIGLIAAQVLGLIAFTPFLPQMSRSVTTAVEQFWLVSNTLLVDWMPALIECSNGATLILESLRDTPPGNEAYLAGLGSAIVGVVAVILSLVYSVREARRHAQERDMWLLLHALLWTPVVVATTISLTIKPILVNRYLIALSIPLYLVMAWMLERFWRNRGVQVVALLFVASIGINLVLLYPDEHTTNKRVQIARTLVSAQQPGDAIAISYWHIFDTVALTHPEVQDVYVVPGPTLDNAYWEGFVTYTNWPGPHSVQPVDAFAPRYQRVWLEMTIYHPDYQYHQQESQVWLEKHGRMVRQVDFDDTVLVLYEMRD
jgi:uncharacterized membrane protein